MIVFPYFLFSGVLVSRIRQHSERVAADHPEVEFLQAGYLGDHPLVIDTIERVAEVVRGDTAMNCSLCKYRQQVLGFETEVGAPQHSHHHHVEGLNEPCQLCENECTGACQPDGVPLPMAMGTATTTPITTRSTPTPTTPLGLARCKSTRKTNRASDGHRCPDLSQPHKTHNH